MRFFHYLFLSLAACTTASSPEMLAARYEFEPTATLWSLHSTTTSALELAFIEAELGSRGESRSGSTYIGRQTARAYGQQLYARQLPTASDRNCSDFASSAAAQKFFLASGGPLTDRHGLDRDGDGLACEWGRTIRQIATTQRAPAYRVPSRPRATQRCYVGPRGGTYTLTASGRKNYGGC